MLKYSQYSYVALIALSFLVYGQELDNPAPSPTETSQKEQDYPASKDHETGRNETVTDNIPVVINTSPPIKTTSPKDEDSSNSNDESSPNRWDWYLTFSGVVALFTIVLGVSTLGLWWFTRKAAIAAADTVRSMNDTASKQLRAYVHTSSTVISHISNDGIVNAKVIFQNYGQTPAYDVMAYATIEYVDLPLLVDFDSSRENIDSPISKGSLQPGGKMDIPINPPAPLGEQRAGNIRNGIGAIFVFGKITYKDIFSAEQASPFCYVCGGDYCVCGGEMYAYHKGNDPT